MSDTPSESPSDAITVKAAAADFEQYRRDFEAKYGYGIGATSNLTPDGRVETVMQLVKLAPKAEVATPPSAELSDEDMRLAEVPDPETPETNGNNETAQTSASDSSEQPKTEAAQ